MPVKYKRLLQDRFSAMSSEGLCRLCGLRFDKSIMARHLGVCLARRPSEGFRRQKTFWLFVEAAYQPLYWLHLESPLIVRLSLLERFLCSFWPVERVKGVFVIEGRRYESPVTENVMNGRSSLTIDALLGELLEIGMRFDYLCGTSTSLILTVIGQQERAWKGRKIEILAHSLSIPLLGQKFPGENGE